MIDYKKIKFKCGLEIHQQISSKKLFCNCTTALKEPGEPLDIKRKIRPVAGEGGEVDVAAAFEFLKDKTYFYHGYGKEFCEVDTDSEPPHNVNQEALLTGFAFAKMLKMDVPNEIHVMRKTVVDGSAISSFQRTMLIAIGTKDSFIKTSLGNVRVSSICLEEDSCKIEKKNKNYAVYSLSRLGIPLLEIRTEPDIVSPEHAKETAKKIGELLRSFSNVKRGIGTIRQDVNISINDGNRVELKGFQDLKSMVEVIDVEVKRQISEDVKEEVRKVNSNFTSTPMRPLPGSQRMYPETDVQPIITTKLLKKLEIPETIQSKRERFGKILPKDLSKQIIKSKYLHLFEKFYERFDPVVTAVILLSHYSELEDKGISEDNVEEILNLIKKGTITKDLIPDLVENISKYPEKTLDEIVSRMDIKKMSVGELNKIIDEVFTKFPDLVKGKRMGALMGEVMVLVKGRISGGIVAEKIKEKLI